MRSRFLIPTLLALVVATPAFAQAKADAEAMVHKAIAALKSQGRDKTLQDVGKPQGPFTKGELYVFVYDMNGVVLAHGQNPKLVGKNLLEAQDPDGKFYVKERIALVKAKGKGWQDYKFIHPVTKKLEEKTAYVELAGNMIFGCGVYK